MQCPLTFPEVVLYGLLLSEETSDQNSLAEQTDKILFCLQIDVTFINQEYIRDGIPPIE